MNNNKIVVVSGYFDPIHIGHLEYFKLAKELGDLLYVIVNNDFQFLNRLLFYKLLKKVLLL